MQWRTRGLSCCVCSSTPTSLHLLCLHLVRNHCPGSLLVSGWFEIVSQLVPLHLFSFQLIVDKKLERSFETKMWPHHSFSVIFHSTGFHFACRKDHKAEHILDPLPATALASFSSLTCTISTWPLWILFELLTLSVCSQLRSFEPDVSPACKTPPTMQPFSLLNFIHLPGFNVSITSSERPPLIAPQI